MREVPAVPDFASRARPALRPFVFSRDPAAPVAGLTGAVFAVGNFDGLHRGHKAVLQRAVDLARRHDRPAAVLTFEPHPSDYFAGAGTIFRLTPEALKARTIEQLGMDGMVVLTFDSTLANLTAEEFVRRILVERLGVGAVVVGYDFHFGKMRTGTPEFLRDAGVRYHFEVAIIDKVAADAQGELATASSTQTRAALEAGDVARAAALLGHPFTISGIVQPGQRLGRTLGYPTANLQADPSCRLRHGIYAVQAVLDGRPYPAVASWGRRPTVDDGPPLLETFLFDFAGDLYGRRLDVSFVGWLRGEEKFASLDALKAQIALDVAQARAMLAGAARGD